MGCGGLTKKGGKIKRALEKEYGKKEGDTVFYKGRASGKFTGVGGKTPKKKK
jgi:hypothetical protein